MPRYDKSLVWFRRDLRCDDHGALHHALKESRLVFCTFIFDKQILDPLLACGARADRRVDFIHASLQSLDDELKRRGGALIVRHADSVAVILELAQRAFKPQYDHIRWESGPTADAAFKAWCEGCTGYPLVDASMLQLNQTGYTHNRLRMVTACFLIKDLGIDWRRGEQYFALKLNDFDLAANNGGWQWAASSGCDAMPSLIFGSSIQSHNQKKFDAEGKFIRRYLPQLAKLDAKRIHAPWLLPEAERIKGGIALGENYPAPIVMHDLARLKTLDRYFYLSKSINDIRFNE